MKNEPIAILSPDEIEEYESSEAGEWISVADFEAKRPLLEAAATRALEKHGVQISISLPNTDLERLKALALQKGVERDVLIRAILHEAALG